MPTHENVSTVTLDFDADGHLLGVEILFASLALTDDVLRSAERA